MGLFERKVQGRTSSSAASIRQSTSIFLIQTGKKQIHAQGPHSSSLARANHEGPAYRLHVLADVRCMLYRRVLTVSKYPAVVVGRVDSVVVWKARLGFCGCRPRP